MPIQQQYYLNGTTLSNSTSVYLDAALSVCSDDGYYSDGTVVRYQADCVLGTIRQCPSCSGRPCAADEDELPIYGFGTEGIYNAAIDVGTGTGAVIIKLTNYTPNGVLAKYNNNTYNKVSVQQYGLTTAPAGLPNYFGDIGTCDPTSGSPYYIPNYDLNTNSFILSPIYDTVNVLPTQENDTNLSFPSVGVMVIPKTTTNQGIIDISHYCVCDTASFEYIVLCPKALPMIIASQVGATATLACNAASNTTYYVASVGGTSTGGNVILDLYDYVFMDPNGQTPAPNGWYTAPIHVNPTYPLTLSIPSFRVQDGIIVEFANDCQFQYLELFGTNSYTGCATPPSGIAATSFNLYWEPLGVQVYGPTTIPSLSATGLANTAPILAIGRYRAVASVTFNSSPTTNCPSFIISMKLTNNCTTPLNVSPVFAPSPGATFTHSFVFDFMATCYGIPPPYPKLEVFINNYVSGPSPL